MGNSASLNTSLNSKFPRVDDIDLDFTKSIPKNLPNLTNKCSACSISMNIISFKRRKCKNCYEYYCPECIRQYKESIYLCYRCTIFISSTFNWDVLMTLKCKDLKWYLERNRINCGNFKEKEQFVELILEKFTSVSEQAKRESHRKKLVCNMENLYDLEKQNQTLVSDHENPQEIPGPSSAIINQTSENLPSSLPISEEQCPNDQFEDILKNPVNLPPPTYEEVVNTDVPTETTHPTPLSCQSDNVKAETNIEISKQTLNENDRTKRVLIESINNDADISNLSVPQLKDLLAYNKVDYKGCLERHELVARVQRLWTSYNTERNGTTCSDLTAPRECVICMDQPIDCVLIECGHMISCVKCGSKLAECPICRQNVVRCLRVFSAH